MEERVMMMPLPPKKKKIRGSGALFKKVEGMAPKKFSPGWNRVGAQNRWQEDVDRWKGRSSYQKRIEREQKLAKDPHWVDPDQRPYPGADQGYAPGFPSLNSPTKKKRTTAKRPTVPGRSGGGIGMSVKKSAGTTRTTSVVGDVTKASPLPGGTMRKAPVRIAMKKKAKPKHNAGGSRG
jgi:hypothetical protein